MIGNHEVRIIMAVIGNMETISILLNYNIILYIFTDQTWLILYKEATNAYITINGNNKVFVIGIEPVLFRIKVLKKYLDIVFYVSYLKASLISMEILQWDRNQLQDCDSRVSIIRNDRELFIVMLIEITSTIKLRNYNTYLLKESTIQFWCWRLEYLNSTIINSI